VHELSLQHTAHPLAIWVGNLSVLFWLLTSALPTCNEMHLGFIDLIRGFFMPRVGNGTASNNGKTDNYYVRGSIRDRGPCPALNALANQGYL
jgi:hypothetical protein